MSFVCPLLRYRCSNIPRVFHFKLPYVGNALSMVIILPPFEDGSLDETVSRMTPENVQGVMAEIKSGFYKADDLKIQIPKFVIEQVRE